MNRLVSTSFATALALALSASTAAAASPAEGVYEGKINGGRATVKVKSAKRANFRFALKTKCGATKGNLTLKVRAGRFKGREAGKGGRSTVVSGRFVAGGERAKGVLRATSHDCRTGRRRFQVSRHGDSGPGGSGDAPGSLTGHYAGSNLAGRQISFDVLPDGDGLAVRNLSVDVDTECWDDLDGDGADDNLLTHITGLEGKVTEGEVDVYYAPDEDTEFSIDGPISRGLAILDVWVGGFFDADGTPNPSGRFECDNWGETYEASRQG